MAYPDRIKTIKYECIYGCIKDRSGVTKHVKNGHIDHFKCKDHPHNGIIIRKYAFCKSCKKDFDLPFNARHRPCYCDECKLTPKPRFINGWDDIKHLHK